MSIGWRWPLGLVFVVCTAGCPIFRVRETKTPVEHEVRRFASELVPNVDYFSANITVEKTTAETIPVRIAITRFQKCIMTEHVVFDRTIVIERTVEDRPTLFQIFGYAAGVTGVTLFTTGAVLGAVHEHEGPPDVIDKTEGASNALMVTGIVALAYFGAHASYDLQAIDSEQHEGLITRHSSPEEKRCHERPAADVFVSLVSPDGDNLVYGRTDNQGVLNTTVSRDDVLRMGPNYQVYIRGRSTTTTTAFSPYHEVFRK